MPVLYELKAEQLIKELGDMGYPDIEAFHAHLRTKSRTEQNKLLDTENIRARRILYANAIRFLILDAKEKRQSKKKIKQGGL